MTIEIPRSNRYWIEAINGAATDADVLDALRKAHEWLYSGRVDRAYWKDFQEIHGATRHRIKEALQRMYPARGETDGS
jgi:hypothetical protein